MQALAQRFGWSTSRVMMPLSFVAILAAMTTLDGLQHQPALVSSALTDLGQPALAIFQFSAIGVVMAAVGAVYAAAILPRILPDRGRRWQHPGDRGQAVSSAEIDVTPDSRLVGATPVAGQFKALPDVTVRVVSRRGPEHPAAVRRYRAAGRRRPDRCGDPGRR